LIQVLTDSSVWVAHFRKTNPLLQALLATDRVLCHPMILIELACGTPPAPRERTLSDLKRLKVSGIATTNETLALIEKNQTQNSGCGTVDMCLLASTLLTPDTLLWTADKNLADLAETMGIAFNASTWTRP
jgi:predicted nucleic acid-binding protein